MAFKTADLYDANEQTVQVLELPLQSYGGRASFSGRIATVQAPEDNTFVRKALEEPGDGRVLVVDGGGSFFCALVGDQLAALAVKNGWSGIIVNGCIRDSEALRSMPMGVKALATNPRKSRKNNRGLRDQPLHFGRVAFVPGEYLYADEDGVLTSAQDLLSGA